MSRLPTSTETIRFYDFYAPLVERIAESFTDTLKSDIDAVKAFESTYTTEEERKANINKLTISLAGKWAPSEKGSFNKKVHTYIRLPDSKSTSKNTAYLYKQSLTHYLARTMFLPGTLKRFTSTSHPPSLPTQVLKEWRLSKSILDKYLEVPEVNMAANEFSQINLKRATSTFMFKARLALLNEKKKVPLQAHESETGNRHPDNEDRVKCRQMFLENLTKIKGGTLSLAQIYVKFKSARSVTEKKVLEAQFNAKVMETEKQFRAYKQDLISKLTAQLESAKSSEDRERLTKSVELAKAYAKQGCLPVCDVSGSMTCRAAEGISCMDVSISLTIATSMMNPEPYKHIAISFTDTPSLLYFYNPQTKQEMTFQEKIDLINRHVGYSTNIGAVMDLVRDIAVKNEIPEAELPNVLIFSDEGFDCQINRPSGGYGYGYYGSNRGTDYSRQWQTTHDAFEKRFTNAGYSSAPMTYYWNLAQKYQSQLGVKNFQAKSDRKGVSMLQGYDPSTLKFVFSGSLVLLVNPPKEAKTQAEAILAEKKSTEDDFLGMVNQSTYDFARAILHESSEGIFERYTWADYDEYVQRNATPPPAPGEGEAYNQAFPGLLDLSDVVVVTN